MKKRTRWGLRRSGLGAIFLVRSLRGSRSGRCRGPRDAATSAPSRPSHEQPLRRHTSRTVSESHEISLCMFVSRKIRSSEKNRQKSGKRNVIWRFLEHLRSQKKTSGLSAKSAAKIVLTLHKYCLQISCKHL